MRERSMLLFKDLMGSVVWWQKGEMKKTVHRAIIPLFFRMSDETQSVAEVQISDLTVDVGTGCAWWFHSGGKLSWGDHSTIIVVSSAGCGVESCSTVVLHGLQGDSLLPHGPHHRLQGTSALAPGTPLRLLLH